MKVKKLSFAQAKAALYATKPHVLNLKSGITLHGESFWRDEVQTIRRYCIDLDLTFWAKVRTFFSNFHFKKVDGEAFGVFTDDGTGFAIEAHNSGR